MKLRRYEESSQRQLVGNICFAALSVAYIRKHGMPIGLHTDTPGADLFGFLPYDNVQTTLDRVPESVHPRFWAAGKIFAIEAEGVGAVHIDLDVFIKKKSLAQRILHNDCDAVVQNFEGGEWNKPQVELLRPIALDLANRGIAIDSPYAFNTGVIGINSGALLDEFVDRYKFMATLASRVLRETFDRDDNAIPDLIAEQANFYQCCRQMRMSVDELLPPFGAEYTPADVDGYQHVLGRRKYEMIPKCLQKLHEIAPDIHRDTIRAVERIGLAKYILPPPAYKRRRIIRRNNTNLLKHYHK